MVQPRAVGQTKDVGFEIGVRKTFPVSRVDLWNFLSSAQGIQIWLGIFDAANLELHRRYKTAENIEGEINVLKPCSHLRMTWKKPEWRNVSTLQIRVIPVNSGTTISFHQEHLLDGQQRNEMKAYWETILDNIEKHFFNQP